MTDKQHLQEANSHTKILATNSIRPIGHTVSCLRIKRKTRTPGIPLEDILYHQGIFNKNRRFGVYFSRRQ